MYRSTRTYLQVHLIFETWSRSTRGANKYKGSWPRANNIIRVYNKNIYLQGRNFFYYREKEYSADNLIRQKIECCTVYTYEYARTKLTLQYVSQSAQISNPKRAESGSVAGRITHNAAQKIRFHTVESKAFIQGAKLAPY